MRVPSYFSVAILMLCASLNFPGLVSKKNKKINQFVFVPSGQLLHQEETKSIQHFFMTSTEVSNAAYRLFLEDLEQKKKTSVLVTAAVQSEAWSKVVASAGPLEANYFIHPAYNEYPVVNISYEGALAYCAWMEDKLKSILDVEGLTVRLPSELEWIYAARGGVVQAPYPWGGYYVRNAKGCALANFTPSDEKNEVKNSGDNTSPVKEDGALFTAPIASYFPNNYGLYNMSGNVAEMISEPGEAMGGSWNSTYQHVQVDSKSNYQEPRPTLGFRPLVSIKGPLPKGLDLNKSWKKFLKQENL